VTIWRQALRQRLDGADQNLKIFRVHQRLGNARAFVGHRERIDFGGAVGTLDALVAEMVERDVPRGHEQERRGQAIGSGRVRLHEPRIGLLHEVVLVATAGNRERNHARSFGS